MDNQEKLFIVKQAINIRPAFRNFTKSTVGLPKSTSPKTRIGIDPELDAIKEKLFKALTADPKLFSKAKTLAKQMVPGLKPRLNPLFDKPKTNLVKSFDDEWWWGHFRQDLRENPYMAATLPRRWFNTMNRDRLDRALNYHTSIRDEYREILDKLTHKQKLEFWKRHKVDEFGERDIFDPIHDTPDPYSNGDDLDFFLNA